MRATLQKFSDVEDSKWRLSKGNFEKDLIRYLVQNLQERVVEDVMKLIERWQRLSHPEME